MNRAAPKSLSAGFCASQPIRASAAGVLFFNNVGYLGMCVHGTIGIGHHAGLLGENDVGDHRIETPVGTVTATLHETGEVTVVNVPSYHGPSKCSSRSAGIRQRRAATSRGAGNWFFLVCQHSLQNLTLANIDQLTEFTWAIRQALQTSGITGSDGGEIDHIELYGPSQIPGVHSKNFVLCPGKAYDRSPCGTGTSAKLACLYADGKLKPGDMWRQESIVGSIFEGRCELKADKILPAIKGSAFITSEAISCSIRAIPSVSGITRDERRARCD